MFCAKCGKELNEGDRFCARCGKPVVMIEESETTTDSSQTANDINIINGEPPIQDILQTDQAIVGENKETSQENNVAIQDSTNEAIESQVPQPTQQEVKQLRKPNIPAEKVFKFESGTGLASIRFYRIVTAVSFEDDHLEIEKYPQRFNNLPLIGYNEISSVIIGKKFSPFHRAKIIAAAVILLICLLTAYVSGIMLAAIFIAFEVYTGINTQITIQLSDGRKTDIYTRDKNLASRFKNDVDRL